MFSLLYCFLIYGYICAVIASEVPAYQLQKDQWLFVNASDESSVTTGSAKKNLSLLSSRIYFCFIGSSIFVCFHAVVNTPLFFFLSVQSVMLNRFVNTVYS